ncbi:hypothetical protein L596_028469 [Steinernema carpocapsae]|uniref:G-protein coupled receptors family 1 profile domain-containing protein n=1 Tax=Steinernema carpocapsae TaxID=34508 RepID=A0A4U5LYJ4_STECR|nr:hypothetical protein L596_028469 [Steinernema carpocapsae]
MPFFEGDFVKYIFDDPNTTKIRLQVAENENMDYPAPNYIQVNKVLTIFRYINLGIGFLIVLISIFRIKTSLLKSYSLFFVAPSILCEIFFLTVSAIWEAIPDSEYRIPIKYRIISRFFETHADYHYLILSNVIITATFLVYRKPFFYQKYFTNRNCYLFFIAAWLLVILVSGLSTLCDTLSIDYNYLAYIKKGPVGNFQYFRPCVQVLLGCYMGFVFVFSILGLVKESSKSQQRRRRLVNVLLYCTLPNVFMFLGIASSILTVYYRSERKIEGNKNLVARVETDQWNRVILTIRYILASVCILLAFSDYRRELLRLWKWLTCHRHLQVEPLFTVASSSVATTRRHSATRST